MGNMERILQLMAEKNASTLYISAHAPIQIRIDDRTTPVNPQLLTPDMCLALLREILTDEQEALLERDGDLNASFTIPKVGNYRVNAMRQRGTYAAVIRYIPIQIPALEKLNLPTQTLSDLVMRQRGLILMVGSTGTGKSTSLAAMLDYRNYRVCGHILTIEDPIEFIFTNRKSVVNQRQLGSDTVNREVALRNAMRQAPDVILVGEILDRSTMSAALAYAQTGHLCLATLHASNSYQALNRILSFYPEEVRPTLLDDLASALAAIVAQRLLRSTDGKRVPAVEIMLNSKLIGDLIEKGDFIAIKDAMTQSMTEGSLTFEEDIARLIRASKVTREEGLQHADSPTNLLWRLQNTDSMSTGQTLAQSLADSAAKSAQGTSSDNKVSFTEFTLDVVNDDEARAS